MRLLQRGVDITFELLPPSKFCTLMAFYCDGPHNLTVIFLTAA